jgi:hypothetical protein
LAFDRSIAIHIDPDRRPSARRTVDLDYFEPGRDAIESLLAREQPVSLKLAPATPLPDHWYDQFEVEWIGHRGECKQQIVWTNDLARHPGRRIATVLWHDGLGFEQMSQSTSPVDAPSAGGIAEFLLEPHAAVLAAGLANDLAHRIGAHRFAGDIGYLASAREVKSPLVSCFKVLEQLPLRRAVIASALRALDGGSVEVKTRGLAKCDLSEFAQWTLTGERRLTLVLTRVAGKHRAIVCQRC